MTTTSTLPGSPSSTPTVADLAERLAGHLAALTGRGESVVVLLDPRSGAVQAVVPGGRKALDGARLLGGLVFASDPAVVRTDRVHDLGVRALAEAWKTSALLVAPCLFGNDVVALVALPLPPGTAVAAPSLVQAVRTLTDRFAAGVVRARLFAAVGLAA